MFDRFVILNLSELGCSRGVLVVCVFRQSKFESPKDDQSSFSGFEMLGIDGNTQKRPSWLILK